MLFSDIRGYTAFSERVDPEVVVEMLNLYFQHQAEIVQRHGGDVDKYVGDQLLAVFQGEDMVENAVRAAIRIQERPPNSAASIRNGGWRWASASMSGMSSWVRWGAPTGWTTPSWATT